MSTQSPQPATLLESTPAPYQRPQIVPPNNGLAITAMIFGIVGAAAGFWAIIPITGYFSAAIAFPLSVVAVICGHLGRAQSKRISGIGRRQAMAGIILGYVSIAIMVTASAAWTVFLFVAA
jgi:hypothetical protein